MSKLDIGCVGDFCIDLCVSGNVVPRFRQIEQIVDDYSLELGGSAIIFASQYSKLGGKVGIVGKVGRDLLGEFIIHRLSHIGVDLRWVTQDKDIKTGIGISLVKPDDRAILTYLGTIIAAKPEDLNDTILNSCRHWHIASFYLLKQLRKFWPHWLSRCKSTGVTISLDPNWDPDEKWDGVDELLPYLDVILPNREEALLLTEQSKVIDATRILSRDGAVVVIKCGLDGAIAIKGNKNWEISADRNLEIADTIGAGDNFNAGFLRAWLSRRSIEEALELGRRCASSSLNVSGGITGQLKESLFY